MRLDDKRQAIEKWQEKSVSDANTPPLLNKLDSSPLDYVKWNTTYRDEVETAEKVASVLRRLNENVALRDQLQTKTSRSEGDEEMLELVNEDVSALIRQLSALDEDVNMLMERRIGADDVVGSSTNIWNISVEGKAGGEEASLFAAELAEMFRAYAVECRHMKVRPVERDDGSEAAQIGRASCRERV